MENYRDRLFFVKPENCDRLPVHMALSKKLLCSPKALRRLQQLIKHKTAYIVPGYPSVEDIKLSSVLNAPLLSGDPQLQFVSSTKAVARRIFSDCGVAVPPGAFEIYDEQEFLNILTILVTRNKEVRTWLFKLDDEFSGRGIAFFSVESV